MRLTSEEEARAFVAARCSTRSLAQIGRFAVLLEEANRTQNLIAAASLPTVWIRHLADSAQLIDHVPRETGPWLDLGSGAGLPGLIIAIMQPEREIVMIESRRLRIEWLNEIIAIFDLRNCRVVGSDVKTAERFDAAIISARAFAPLPRLISLSARFSTNDTCWVLPKGRSAAQEVAALGKKAQKLFHVEQSVTDAEAGIIVGRGRVEIAV